MIIFRYIHFSSLTGGSNRPFRCLDSLLRLLIETDLSFCTLIKWSLHGIKVLSYLESLLSTQSFEFPNTCTIFTLLVSSIHPIVGLRLREVGNLLEIESHIQKMPESQTIFSWDLLPNFEHISRRSFLHCEHLCSLAFIYPLSGSLMNNDQGFKREEDNFSILCC